MFATSVVIIEVPAMSEPTPVERVRCMHLCCRSMVIYGEDFESDPEYQAGMTEFWCVRTSKNRGPDGEDISMDLCSNPQRECHQEY
jgi:hypothetical protein